MRRKRKPILDRYDRTEDGKFLIDITTGRIEDLYNNFDKTATYLKKDLDQDLVDYIVDSAKEIGKETFILQFRFNQLDDKTPIERVKTSILNYFLYLKELEKRELKKLRRNSFMLFAIGITILTSTILIGHATAEQESLALEILIEGMTIASWVSIWEAIAIYLIQWKPHIQNIHLYGRVAHAEVTFSQVSAP